LCPKGKFDANKNSAQMTAAGTCRACDAGTVPNAMSSGCKAVNVCKVCTAPSTSTCGWRALQLLRVCCLPPFCCLLFRTPRTTLAGKTPCAE
jgi:hypothetical protein